MNRPFFTAVLSVALILPIGACSRDGADEADEATVPARLVVGGVSRIEGEGPTFPRNAEASEADSPTDQSATEPVEEMFQLPFPERTDLFEEPDVEFVSQPDLQGEGDTAELRLKGFVVFNGQQQALVMWNGKIQVVSEGDQLGDIEIIKVAPPEILFKRGRERLRQSLHTYGE